VSLTSGRVDKLFQVGNQILKLRDLDITLDYIAWVQVSNGLKELLKSVVVLLFLIEVVCMLLRYLSHDLWREV
jgi:hypothetical protein